MELLRAIEEGGAKVVLFHLLERGDASWLTRDAICARLHSLVPVTDPAGRLFRSAVAEADKVNQNICAVCAAMYIYISGN